MRTVLLAIAGLLLSTGALMAQGLGFDDFVWTFDGTGTASGSVTSEFMHVTGPAFGFCPGGETATFTTVAPFAGTVRAHVEWDIQDACHYDWPVYTVNGLAVKIPVSGDPSCFLPGSFDLSFDVEAGDAFGLGVGSADCAEGPGLADFTDLSLLPPAWIDAGPGLDPRLELEIAPAPSIKAFGSALTAIGDVDGDGLSELAINGSPWPSEYASVWLYSGTGAKLWRVTGPQDFGSELVALGDVDGDGAPDVAVSNRVESNVVVLSGGVEGHTLWSWTWSGSELDYYASGLAAHADLDGDGILDLAVGASQDASLPVRVLSGATGVELTTIPPSPGDENFGAALGAAGDLDGDGRIELMVGAFGTPQRVRVYSGATGAALLELHPTSPYPSPWSGVTLTGVDDWTGDGVPELAVGASFDQVSASAGQGSVSIFDGATGSIVTLIAAPPGTVYFGRALASGTDVDGDGLGDLAIAAPAMAFALIPQSGYVRIVRAPDAAVLQEFFGAPDELLGQSLGWLGGAPAPTLAVGMPVFEGASGPRTRLYSDLLHPGGAPGLSMYGQLVPGTPWMLQLDHGLPGSLAFLLAGDSAMPVSFKGGVLVPGIDLMVPVALDGDGRFTINTVAPPGLTPAVTLWLQAWLPDPAGPAGWSATRALRSPPP